jgi:hypothetical protein
MTTHISGYFEFRKDCQVSNAAFSARYVHFFFAASVRPIWYRGAKVDQLLPVQAMKAYGEVEI